jgi:hypothetical protein
MGKLSEQEDAWQTQATAAAVAEARAIAQSQLANVAAGRLTEQQMGWVVVAAIFGWIKTRYQQAITEGLDREQHVARMNPSPRDSAVVGSILSKLADQAAIDWSKPLASWSKREMLGFIGLAMHLIDEAKAVLKDDGFPEIPAFLKRSQEKPRAESELNDPIPF